MASATLGRVSPVPKGEYSADQNYTRLDIVTYQGYPYIAKTDVPAGNPPTDTLYWLALLVDLDFAPGGFGLGKNAQSIDSLDNANKFGLYLSNVGGPPAEGRVYWVCLVMPHNTTLTIAQVAYQSTLDPLRFAVRRMTNGEWGEWEYVNPPMYEGIEYRTTERWGNKPVYVKRVAYITTDVGANGEVSSVTIPHGVDNLGTMIRNNSKIGTQYFLPYMSTSGGMTVLAQHTATSLILRMNGSWSGERTWTFDIAYTKA